MSTKTQKLANSVSKQAAAPKKAQSSKRPRRRISQIFFFGSFMGFCDLVPGISGGTIAYLLGFYEELLEAFSAIGGIFKNPKRGIKAFFSEGKARFWFFLVLGDAFAILLFSKALHVALRAPWIRAHLLSFFLGLILICTLFYLRDIRFNKRSLSALFIGFSVAIGLATLKMTGAFGAFSLDLDVLGLGAGVSLGIDALLFVAGALAATAMLLPGISGSTLLLAIGIYPTLISALALFSESLFMGKFHMPAFIFLSKIGLGVLTGFLLGSRLIRFCLSRWENSIMALLSGFILGALPMLWPFSGAAGEKGLLVSAFTSGAFSLKEVSLISGCLLAFAVGAFLSKALSLRLKKQRV